MDRKVFDDGIAEIITAFNMEMTKEKADIWYKHSRDLEENEWNIKVENCIRNCHRIPTLADILDKKKYYEINDEFPPEVIQRAKNCFARNPGCYSGGNFDDPITCQYCVDYLRSFKKGR